MPQTTPEQAKKQTPIFIPQVIASQLIAFMIFLGYLSYYSGLTSEPIDNPSSPTLFLVVYVVIVALSYLIPNFFSKISNPQKKYNKMNIFLTVTIIRFALIESSCVIAFLLSKMFHSQWGLYLCAISILIALVQFPTKSKYIEFADH